jgi:hypothetical protein
MEHPFVGDLSHMSIDELIEKISSLSKAIAFTSRSGNYGMANQIQMALNSYRGELNRQQAKLLEGDDALTGTIDIT